MQQPSTSVNASFARTKNILLLAELIQRSLDRQLHVPGIVVLSGPSGYGKSFASAAAAAKFRAYYCEAKFTWSRKAMLEALLKQVGVVPAVTVAQMSQQLCEQLTASRRPLILDEVDHVIERNLIELVREIYEGTGSTIVLVGEEMLPQKLQRWERVHGRVLDWAQAKPADMDDAKALAKFYCPQIEIKEDWLAAVVEATAGSLRRICVNLARVNELAVAKRLKTFDRSAWGDAPFNTGAPPRVRSLPKPLESRP
jgi:DNA transposition AAA+ family ATPase